MPTQTGSFVESVQTGGANTGSFSVTVPSDATIAIVCVAGFSATANYFTSGSVTLGGQAMTPVSAASDASTGFFLSAMFYLVNPPTGSQTVAWNWAGTGTYTDGVEWVFGFYKDVNTGSPIRDSDGVQGQNATYTSKTLTAQSGDLIVAWNGTFAVSGTAYTWTNATDQGRFPASGTTLNAAGTIGHASPTGNQTVAANNNGSPTAYDGGLSVVVLKPAATTQTIAPAADVSRGSWVGQPGSLTSNIYTTIDESSPSETDYIESSDSPGSADIYKFRMAAASIPVDRTGHTLSVRTLKSAANGDVVQITVKLYAADGTTLIKAWTAWNAENAVTQHDLTLTSGEAANIPQADYATGLVVTIEAIKV